VIDVQGKCELRESETDYLVNFAPENYNVKNTYLWNAIADISG
jgi:hypothetical protein